MANEEASNPLPLIEDIRSKTTIPVFEVTDDLPELEGPSVIGSNDMESLLSFATAVDAKVLFVQYDYLDMMDYIVDPADYSFDEIFDEDETLDVMHEMYEHNQDVCELFDSDDANKPVACSIYVMYEGSPYGIFCEDIELIESFGETADEYMTQVLYDFLFEDVEDDSEEEPEADKALTSCRTSSFSVRHIIFPKHETASICVSTRIEP